MQKEWPIREEICVGDKNVSNVPLVDMKNIVFQPLPIKLGLFKQFIKALCKEGIYFQYTKASFPSVGGEKVETIVFDRPQSKKQIKDPTFISSMNDVEANAWKAFVSVVMKFLSNRKQDDCIILVKNLIKNFDSLGCNMSIKLHFCIVILATFLKILETLVMNREIGIVNTLKRWRNIIKVDGAST